MKFQYVVSFLSVFWVFPLAAQPVEPSTQQMIDQLKLPKTRSLRNLTIQSAPAVPAVPTLQSPSVAPVVPTLSSEPVPAAVTTPAVNATVVVAPMPSVSDQPPASPLHGADQKEISSLTLMINFDLNASTVSKESKLALKNLAKAMQSLDLQSAKFEIQGHTDAKGRASHNQKLSQQRADAVSVFLVRQGVAPNRLVSVGKGSTELARPDQPFASENRRVRVVNLD